MRCAHYSANMLLWEYKTLKVSSQLSCGTFGRPDDFEPVLIPACKDRQCHSGWKLRAWWFNMTKDYTSRLLTKETDKEAAFSGLAAKHAEESMCRCIADI